MAAKRLKEILGLMMVGEGVLATVMPQRYARLWESGPAWWRRMIHPLVQHPDLTRVIGAAEAMVGYWIAVRQLPAEPATA
jgi:uncharacterized protein YjeT (DUF2065 family)